MTRRTVPAQTGFLSGVLATTFMILIMFAFRVALEWPSVLELLGDGLLNLLPGAYFSMLLDSMQQVAKPALYSIMVIGQLLAGGAIGQWYARDTRPTRVLTMVLVLWAVFGFVLFPVLGLGAFGDGSRSDALAIAVASLIAFLTFGMLLATFVNQLAPSEQAMATGEQVNRRRFVGWLGLSMSAFGLTVVGWRIGASSPETTSAASDDLVRHGESPIAHEPSFGVTGLPSEVTPTADFYTVSKNLSFLDPVIDPKSWQLKVDGLVERPLVLTFDDISRLPSVTDFYTLQCISNEVGGNLIGNAQWKGFRLADLLTEAGLKPDVVKVVFHCSDDYQVSIRPDRAMHPDTIAAYEMNGLPLTKEHGAPLRIVVPGLYGLMNAKWVRRIELVKHDHKGYWQSKGWSDVATYQTSTRVDVPRDRPSVTEGEVTVGGIAFAGDRGLAAVEVSLDKGKTWRTAEMKPPLGQNAWGLWRYTWYAEPGSYTVHARAIDGLGQVQPAEVRGPMPDGATGLHEISVKVAAEPRPKTA